MMTMTNERIVRATQILRGRPVLSAEAHEAVNRLVARAHNGPGPKSTMSIPVQASDDDVLLTDYLIEVEAERDHYRAALERIAQAPGPTARNGGDYFRNLAIESLTSYHLTNPK